APPGGDCGLAREHPGGLERGHVAADRVQVHSGRIGELAEARLSALPEPADKAEANRICDRVERRHCRQLIRNNSKYGSEISSTGCCSPLAAGPGCGGASSVRSGGWPSSSRRAQVTRPFAPVSTTIRHGRRSSR